MSEDDARTEAPSGAPLDEAPAAAEERTRYELGGLLGRGGMGEVRYARDTRLGRPVALKTARLDGPEMERLAREARLTAGLEHPGIIPVYDAGRGEGDVPYYTMRLLPGRSLADAIRETPELAARLRLVRHLVDAAEAISYAHGQGVLHRDLKPGNIMVGAFGETVVADWGLACTLEEGARVRAGGAGSAGYMSPEQARGAPLDARTDIYGLGAVLYELLVGASPPADRAAPPIRALAPEAPAALVAIADRALQPDPAARYPSARTFAEDLHAWYEGRRVSAHVYTARESLGRLLVAWRVPIRVGALGLLALVTAVAVGLWRTAEEQARAQASEARAVAAQAAEEAALAQALVAQARSAAAQERPLEAELLAAHALLRAPSPWARGVLSRFGASPRPTRTRSGPDLPACFVHQLSPSGAAWVCLERSRARLLDPMRPEQVQAQAAGAFVAAAFAGDARLLLADTDANLHVWDPPAAPRRVEGRPLFPRPVLVGGADPAWVAVIQSGSDWVVPLDGGVPVRRETCAGSPVATAPVRGGDVLVGCGGGRIVRVAPTGATTPVFVVPREDGGPSALLPLPDGGLLVGTVNGRLLSLQADGSERARTTFGNDAISELRAAGGRAVIQSTYGLGTWDFAARQEAGLLEGGAGSAAWRPDGELRIASARAEDRRLPAPGRQATVPLPGGVACVAISPDGREVAVGTGDGSISVVDLATGRVARGWKPQAAVVKDLAWSPDGRRLAVASASPVGQPVLDSATGEVLAQMHVRSARRVIWSPDGPLWATYHVELRGWPDPGVGTSTLLAAAQLTELEGDGTILALDLAGAVFRVGEAGKLEPLATVAGAVSVVPVGAEVFVGTDRALVRLDADGRVASELPVGSPVLDLAASPDGRFLALGHADGTVTVLRPGAPDPIAILEGHRARVSALAFTPDGTELVTGSWDSTVRIWSVPPMGEDPPTLVAQMEAAWGRGLADVLDPRR